MAREKTVSAFVSGVHNKLDKEIVPADAAVDSYGWITKDGHIELAYGRQTVGGDGAAGKVWAEHTGFKTDGTEVHFRKIWDGTEGKVQYLNGSTWTDVITGLANSDISFTNYSSLAGNFVYLGSPEDGLYKIVTSHPGSYSDVYDSTKNFKGYLFVDKGRAIMWGTKDDATGLYGSHIDSQDSDVYTTVSAEAIGSSGSTNYTGTLAFRAGGSTRTCFGVTFTDGTQTITIDFTGNATSDSDGTGTVNFTTGAYDVTFDATTTGAVTSDYQWEDSNADGVTDFSKSATRVAGEGFIVRQDVGGDAIKVVIPFDGSYFSIKERSIYKFTLDPDDTNPTNEIVRTNIGIKTKNAAAATSLGTMFIDTGNPTEPRLTILKRNVTGDNFTTEALFPQFAFENYTYDDVAVVNWDRYLVIACNENSTQNDTLLMCDILNKTVDPVKYEARCFTTKAGLLYAGSPVTTTSYELFTGFDDSGQAQVNLWTGSADKLGYRGLKKVKKHRFRGRIAPDQAVKVYISYDSTDLQHVGTILGSGDYVDYNTTFAVGTTMVGQDEIGGGDTGTVYNFLMELKLRTGKFRIRQIAFEATGIGFVQIDEMQDYDIWLYEERIPKKYRLKQNVSIDGATVNQDNPEY